MNKLRQNILRTLVYFDIFNYPLKSEEVRLFLPIVEQNEAINAELELMLQEQLIFKINDLYSLHNDPGLSERRQKGNNMAAVEMTNAARAAKLLSRFPYVAGIAISGSLSKDLCTADTDIDFFVITRANRLWIARTFMHAYKKLTFLTGRQKWYCMNYYVDEARPEIEEKNIFTAIEVTTLIPMHGKPCLERFLSSNTWIKDHFPAHSRAMDKVLPIKKGLVAKLIEALLNNGMGNWIDDRLMAITKRRWQKKEQRKMKNDRGFLMSMLVDKHYSKPDPKNFQQQILDRYDDKLKDVLQYPYSLGHPLAPDQ